MKRTNLRFLTWLSLALVSLLSVPTTLCAQLPAFPGAEGFGRYTTGGRGGAVYHVTKLTDDDSKGTFRWACAQKGKRTIVFDVSGTIQLTKGLRLNQGDVTIAGQTAPGDGICIAGYPFVISADNVIIRFLRFRLGNENVAYHEGDGLGGMDRSNIIIDHCSVSWSIDECLSVYGSKNLTVQWCMVTQSLKNSGHAKGAHGYGGNWGGSGASYHHNLMAHHDSRVPRLGPRPSTQEDERMDLRNNVFYNWGGNGCYGGEGMNVNIVNNYYKPGPTTLKKTTAIQKRIAAPGIRTVDYCLGNKSAIATAYNAVKSTSLTDKNISGSYSGGKYYVTCGSDKYEIDMVNNTITVDGNTINVAWNEWKPMLHKWGTFYVDGNYNPNYPSMNEFTDGVSAQIDKKGNDGTYPGDDKVRLSAPIAYTAVTTHSASKAFEKVLAYAGASLKRDALDEIMVNDARTGTATFTGSGNTGGIINSQNDVTYSDGSKGWPALNSTAAPADTDQDGMPDAWETAHGLNPNEASDGNSIGEGGYTNLEIYMNSLVSEIVEGGNADGQMLENGEIYEPEGSESSDVSYTLSSETATCEDKATTWTFNNGCTITSEKGDRGYAKGSNGTMKFSRNYKFYINIPENVSVKSVTFTGYCNSTTETSTTYLSEVNGTEYGSTEYVFTHSGTSTSHTITFDTPVTGNISFTPKGDDQSCFAITLQGTKQTTGIVDVIANKREGNGKIYNLQGIEIANPTKGIYIRNGKKFIVK